MKFASPSVIPPSMSPARQVIGHNKLLTTLPYRSCPDTSVTTRISFIAPQTSTAILGSRFGSCATSMFASASLKSTRSQQNSGRLLMMMKNQRKLQRSPSLVVGHVRPQSLTRWTEASRGTRRTRSTLSIVIRGEVGMANGNTGHNEGSLFCQCQVLPKKLSLQRREL